MAPKTVEKTNTKALSNILMRIVAVFAASGLSVLGAGAVVGIDTTCPDVAPTVLLLTAPFHSYQD